MSLKARTKLVVLFASASLPAVIHSQVLAQVDPIPKVLITDLLTRGPLVPAPVCRLEGTALGDAIVAMIAATKAHNYAEAIAHAEAADAMENKPPCAGTLSVRSLILSYAISAMDYQTAIAELDKRIADGTATAENLKLRDVLMLRLREQSTSGQAPR